MSGMWPLMGLAGMMLAGFGALVIGGIAVVHVGYRWWLMLFCGLDWDDAGALIRARYRRKHGLHEVEQPRPEPDIRGLAARLGARAGQPYQEWIDTHREPVTPGQRYDVTARLPRVPVTGNPPWAGDVTHVLPVVSNTETETWLRPDDGR